MTCYSLRLYLIGLLVHLIHWDVFAQQLTPNAWPIAVKNPYLNSWFEYGNAPKAFNQISINIWPNGTLLTRWYCAAVVDGVPYRMMSGESIPNFNVSEATTNSIRMTPTQTIFEMQTGPVDVTMNFLSPVTGTDLTRQSLPFSYLSINVTSTDGNDHSVKIYSDVTLDWITTNSKDSANPISQDVDDDFVFLEYSLQSPQPFAEDQDRAQDSSVVYALKANVGVQFEVGNINEVRSFGMNSTGLRNLVAPGQLGQSDVWALSADLGNLTTTTSPVVYAIGLIRDPSIKFSQLRVDDVQLRNSYYQMNFSTPRNMVAFFLDDYNNATDMASLLDSRIASDATEISLGYGDLLTLVTRQAMGAIEITVSKNADGSFNSSDIMAFMKDMGSMGQGMVNAVDVLYAAFPIYIYLNPAIGGYLLKPLLIAQDSPLYTQPFAAQGLGSTYPNVTIEDLPHNFGIEESGNMIIMILAHLQTSGDASLVEQHYGLIQRWADYLVASSMSPDHQQSAPSDGITISNQTNLALKGIIGIGGMARISSFLGKDRDASKYNDTAKSYMEQWQNLTISQDKTHLKTSFESDDSTGLIYNLYADKLLRLDLVPQTVYDLQTSYYRSQIGTNEFGIPLDSSDPTMTRADWMLFAAAASSDNDLRTSLISQVHSFAFAPGASRVVSPVYDPSSGNDSAVLGVNSPSMGALFSVLALDIPFQANVADAQLNATSSSRNKVTVVVGAAVGGVVGLTVFSICIFIYRRRRRGTDITTAQPFSGAEDVRRPTPVTRRHQHVSEKSRFIFRLRRNYLSGTTESAAAAVGVDDDHWTGSQSENSETVLTSPFRSAPRTCTSNYESFSPPSYTSEEPSY